MADSGRLVPRRLTEPVTRAFAELSAKVDAIQAGVTKLQDDVDRLKRISRYVQDDEANVRRWLYALRASPDYELAFTEKEPLVTFVVSTYTSYETLRDRALPSILGQSYDNLDVIVVGDAAPPDTAEVIKKIGDKRVRYANRSVRGPYPEGPDRWLVIGTPAYNEGVSIARGRWIASLSDDDAIRQDHTEKLLEAAQYYRLEHCYGRQLVHFADDETLELGEFPPAHGQFGFQSAIYHAGLRFMEMDQAAAVFGEPNDWNLCRRMLSAGVRFGMIKDVVADKYEGRRTREEWEKGRIPDVD
jgi:hypothetical protein